MVWVVFIWLTLGGYWCWVDWRWACVLGWSGFCFGLVVGFNGVFFLLFVCWVWASALFALFPGLVVDLGCTRLVFILFCGFVFRAADVLFCLCWVWLTRGLCYFLRFWWGGLVCVCVLLVFLWLGFGRFVVVFGFSVGFGVGDLSGWLCLLLFPLFDYGFGVGYFVFSPSLGLCLFFVGVFVMFNVFCVVSFILVLFGIWGFILVVVLFVF